LFSLILFTIVDSIRSRSQIVKGATAMKKIRVWEVLLWSLLTLGLYQVYWIYRTRNELVENYKQSIPSFAEYLLIPGGLIIAAIVTISFSGNDDPTPLAWILFWVFFLVAMAYAVYWIYQYAKAAEAVTNGKMNRWATIALFLLADNIAPSLLQYFYNRIEE